MRKGLVLTTMLLSFALVISGCLGRQGDLGNKNIRPNAVQRNDTNGNMMNKQRFANDQDNEMNRMYGNQTGNNNVIGMHGNSRIELSDKIADKIAAMPGIDTSFVMMTDHNAYVAVTQDRQA